MNTNLNPKELAIALCNRSTCHVQVAAVIADKNGIFAWGWNSPGKGFGEHAEAMAFKRANKKRIANATIYVAAKRKKHGRCVIAKPCRECQRLTINCKEVIYRDKDGVWR